MVEDDDPEADERPSDAADDPLELFDTDDDDRSAERAGTLMGAIGEILAAVLIVVVIAALLIGGAAAFRLLFG